MPDITDVNYIRSVFMARSEEDYSDFLYELQYESPGAVLDDLNDIDDVPDNWVFKIHEVEADKDYDSYGNSYTDEAYVIISVSDNVQEVLYKIPGSYASYEGWNWDLAKISRVEKREKVVKTWEWTDV